MCLAHDLIGINSRGFVSLMNQYQIRAALIQRIKLLIFLFSKKLKTISMKLQARVTSIIYISCLILLKQFKVYEI